MNGLLRFSSPIVVGGPCPGYAVRLSGRAFSFCSDCCIWCGELSGKSVLPIEPANSVSPVNAAVSPKSVMLPLLCPGVCMTFRVVCPNLTKFPSLRSMSGFGEWFLRPSASAMACAGVPSRCASSSWIMMGVWNLFFTVPFPQVWSGCPWVLTMYFGLSLFFCIKSKICWASVCWSKPGSIIMVSRVFWHVAR
jgi:hypothetical protein